MKCLSSLYRALGDTCSPAQWSRAHGRSERVAVGNYAI